LCRVGRFLFNLIVPNVKNKFCMDKIREQIEWNIDKYSPEMATEEILNLFIVNGIDFAKWLQDNYSTNDKQGSNKPLPKGYWRKDFTDDVYKIETVWDEYHYR